MPLGIKGFVKGQSGNPGGRPKLPWTFMGLYQEELEKVIATGDKAKTKIEAKRAMAKKLVQMAIDGDIQAIKELANRIEGLPLQRISGADNGPLEIVFKRQNAA